MKDLTKEFQNHCEDSAFSVAFDMEVTELAEKAETKDEAVELGIQYGIDFVKEFLIKYEVKI